MIFVMDILLETLKIYYLAPNTRSFPYADLCIAAKVGEVLSF